ncbi:MAG: hypothetical protein NWF14_06880 [Candidatus Bathyarchaeota archaeon]|nr:hypothetical protein [Candidatus Bathyarchaeota archaeon]
MRNVKVSLQAAMLAPILLALISAFVYAQWSKPLTCFTTLTAAQEDIEITSWAINFTNTQDVDGDTVVLGDELNITEVKNPSNGQTVGLEITVDPIFPGWVLHLVLEVYNRPSPYSLPVNLSYAMYCWNETSSAWESITEADLQTLFSLTYVDGFYLDAELSQPMPSEYTVQENEYFYKSEYVKLDESAPQTCQGHSVQFRVEIYAEWAGV